MSFTLPQTTDEFGKLFEETVAETFASDLCPAEATMYNPGYSAGSEVGCTSPYSQGLPSLHDYIPRTSPVRAPTPEHNIHDFRHPLHKKFFNIMSTKRHIADEQRYASINLTRGYLGKQGYELQQEFRELLSECIANNLWHEALQVVADSVVIEWPLKVFKTVADPIGEDFDRPPLYHIKKPGGEKEKETGVRKETQMLRVRWLAVPMQRLQGAHIEVRIVDVDQYQSIGKVERRHREGNKNEIVKVWDCKHHVEPRAEGFKEPVEVLACSWIKQPNQYDAIDQLEFSIENFTIAACNRGEKKPLRLNALKLDIVLDFGFGRIHYGECKSVRTPKCNLMVQHLPLRTEPFYVLTSMTQIPEHLLLRTYSLLQARYQQDGVEENQDRVLPFSIIDNGLFRSFLQSRCDVTLRNLDELELRHIYMKVLLPYLSMENLLPTNGRVQRGKRQAQSSRVSTSSLSLIEEKIEYLFGEGIDDPHETPRERQALFLHHPVQDHVEVPLSLLQGVFIEWFYGVADMLGESNRSKFGEAKSKKDADETKKSALLCEVPNNRQRSFMPYLFNERTVNGERVFEHYYMGLDELKNLNSGIGGALPFAFAHHHPCRYQCLAKFVDKPTIRIKLNPIFNRPGAPGVFRISKPEIKPSFLYGPAPSDLDIEQEIEEAGSIVAKTTLTDDASSVATGHRVQKRGNHLTSSVAAAN